MKFLHCADLHIDSPLLGLADRPGAPAQSLRLATRRALENLVALAIREKVQFVVIAGDVFDGDWPDYTTGLFFNARMADLQAAGIRVYMVSGNHDAASHITRHLALPENVVRFSVDRAETYRIDEFEVAIHGQGFKEREVRDNLVPGYPEPLPGYFNIGVLHTSVDGLGGHETYAPCRLEELVQKGYDYWALGHIHKRQILHEHPVVAYAGNLQGRHARETGEKGCLLVSVDGERVAVEFRALDVLRWYVCSVDLTGADAIEEVAARVSDQVGALAERDLAMPLAVRIVLTGRTPLYGSMLADPEYTRSEVENAAALCAPGRIWVEQVKVDAVPLSVSAEHPTHHDALAALVNTVQELAEDEEFLRAFAEDAERVLRRLGAYAKREGTLHFQSPDDVRPLLKDALALVGALMDQGRVDA